MNTPLKALVLLLTANGDYVMQVTTTGAGQTFTFTRLRSTTPTVVDWGDGSTSQTADNSNPLSHIYASAGTYIITITQPELITELDLRNPNAGVTLSPFTLTSTIARMTALTYAYLRGDAITITGDLSALPAGLEHAYFNGNAMTITGDLSELPAGLDYVYFAGNDMTITGNLSSLPTGVETVLFDGDAITITGDLSALPTGVEIAYFIGSDITITGNLSSLPAGLDRAYFAGNDMTITGDLSALPAGLSFLWFDGNDMTITGDLSSLRAGLTLRMHIDVALSASNIIASAIALQIIRFDQLDISSTGRTQSQIDTIIDRIHDARTQITSGDKQLYIGGTNAAPSTGSITKINDLTVNFGWTITYTAP